MTVSHPLEPTYQQKRWLGALGVLGMYAIAIGWTVLMAFVHYQNDQHPAMTCDPIPARSK